MTTNPLPCLVCGKPLEHAWGNAEANGFLANQPMGGTAFLTSGHYGSGVFDEINGTKKLEIAICDSCLEERWGRTRETQNDTKPAFIVAREPEAQNQG